VTTTEAVNGTPLTPPGMLHDQGDAYRSGPAALTGAEVAELVTDRDTARDQVATLERAAETHRTEIAQLRRDLVAMQDAQRQAVQEFRAFKENAVVQAHEWAHQREFCGDFDDCMEEIGLDRRDGCTRSCCQQEYEVTVRVVYDVTVSLTASSPTDARDSVSEDDVYERVETDCGNWHVVGVEQV
jgi:hypothetical protein